MTIKTIALAAAAAAMTASAAAADSYFSFGEKLDNSSTLELGTVRAADNGVGEIYSLLGGGQGRLLGTEEVMAGANNDVRVHVGSGPNFDVLAVLKIDGQIVDQQRYEIDRD